MQGHVHLRDPETTTIAAAGVKVDGDPPAVCEIPVLQPVVDVCRDRAGAFLLVENDLQAYV